MKTLPTSDREDALTQVIPATTFLSQKLAAGISPFKVIPRYVLLKIYILTKILSFFQRKVGSVLCVTNELGELSLIDSRIRALLLRLARAGVITSWYVASTNSDAPKIINYKINLGPITLPNGKRVEIRGSQGSGVGENINDAIIPALAEALERHSSATWTSAQIKIGSFQSLKAKNAVPPNTFEYFSQRQRQEPSFARRNISETKELGWVEMQALSDRKTYLVPAQLVYLFYGTIEPQIFFFNTTTNGLAAHTTYAKAAYRAVCEAIERDALMIFWLNEISPPRVNIESISVAKVKKQIQELEMYGFEIYILDLTTDLAVPVLGALLLDKSGGTGVSLSAACGYDTNDTLQRVLYEILKFSHKRPPNSLCKHSADNIKAADIKNMTDRSKFWSSGKQNNATAFFMAGPEKNYADLVSRGRMGSDDEYLEELRKTLNDLEYQCYFKDISSEITRQEGLFVVRALLPDLAPIYFSESERPYGVKRLFTVPQKLGYSNTPTDEESLNQTPHPFI